ncbi:hypothetical protein [Oxynema aestuarii]|uniref:Uncharacterized protein n=1 Tax=Oxynema aestuarii AP17 TaxID=2064643 RepID=A0A6H1U0A2_9CYAN|nr:hypothetical protein [Oxynema aestuarii]QIZ72264.1 hypothetical protein HCG48_18180 [Oxynema aestuarii AP17]
MAFFERQDNLNHLNSLSNWFDLIFREIAVVQTQINQKNGFWIFQRHIYSQEELLKSPILNKIDAMTQNIGYNLQSWAQYGKLHKETQEFYIKKRDEVSSKLEKTHEMIAQRQPTWWEQSGAFFLGATQHILENLPLMIELISITRRRFPGLGKQLLSGMKSVNKLLPGSK